MAKVSLTLKWSTCGEDGHWCNLKRLALPLQGNPLGVYIIWLEGDPGPAVYVGQGNISARLAHHRNDPEILECADHGTLLATWAKVSKSQRDGVERYLADELNPVMGDSYPEVDPIRVNIP